jgi:hypothetical protein
MAKYNNHHKNYCGEDQHTPAFLYKEQNYKCIQETNRDQDFEATHFFGVLKIYKK